MQFAAARLRKFSGPRSRVGPRRVSRTSRGEFQLREIRSLAAAFLAVEVSSDGCWSLLRHSYRMSVNARARPLPATIGGRGAILGTNNRSCGRLGHADDPIVE